MPWLPSISHEINQPLIAIQNYAQAVKRRLQNKVDDKPKLAGFSRRSRSRQSGGSHHSTRSVAGRHERCAVAAMPLCPLVEEVIRMMEPETERRGAVSSASPQATFPWFLPTFAIQLVLVNLCETRCGVFARTNDTTNRCLLTWTRLMIGKSRSA